MSREDSYPLLSPSRPPRFCLTYRFLRKFLGAGFGGGSRQRLRDSAFLRGIKPAFARYMSAGGRLVTQVVPKCQQNFKFIFWELAAPVSVEMCVASCTTIIGP